MQDGHSQYPASGAQQTSPIAVASVHQVTIYVIEHCGNCAYAYEVAAGIRRDYPCATVRIVDLANPQEPVPDSVFATPTYLLDGRVWSLGNPSLQQVREALGPPW